MYAHFQSSGICPVLIEVSKILANGMHNDLLTSFSTLGCTPSGPGDLEIFSLSSQGHENVRSCYCLQKKNCGKSTGLKWVTDSCTDYF